MKYDNMKYPELFSPVRLGKLELRNRVVMPPMTTCFARDGFVTDMMIDHYAARAKGGAGLVIVEDCIVDTPLGNHGYNDIFIDDDKYIPDLKRLANAIKEYGAKAAIQLNFSGRMAGKLRDGCLKMTGGRLPVAPSAIAYPATGFVVPHDLAVDEIRAIENRFAAAARRAKEAGFDAVSLHCSHQFLIEQFLSPLSNHRRDDYGGSPEHRLRFVLEIIEKAKRSTGEDYPLICRISGKELLPGGLTLKSAGEIARALEKAGVVALNVSHGANPAGIFPQPGPPPAARVRKDRCSALVLLAAAIKRTVSIPVMAVGGIIAPGPAEYVLAGRKADLVCVGKGLIADPEWPVKALEGRETDIRECTACGQCLSSVGGTRLTCAVNPAVGR
jgi:2,4-dienoyl-CoA reductase-like NADH-dependent reductase (Old Yellow Enzyme family)